MHTFIYGKVIHWRIKTGSVLKTCRIFRVLLLNGSDYAAIPFEPANDNTINKMEIGYVVRKNTIRSQIAELYIRELRRYLNEIR